MEGLVRKTAGLAGLLRDALRPLSKKIKIAFVYGSMARGSVKSQSDVDLMVIGSCDFAEVVEALMPVQEKLGREVNPSVYPIDEFQKKIAAEHYFVKTVLGSPKILLIGEEHELTRLAQK